MRSWLITLSRKVRWSRKKRIESGSTTLASGPTLSSKKIDAIGVTYSWLKRMSVRKKPASPGRTHATPVSPFAASVTRCRAKIFSASVIGRVAGGVPPCAAVRGIVTRPCRRATLNSKSPPCSMIWRVMSSVPRVNSSSAISSPARMRSRMPKSVVVSTPRFWQFSL